MDFGAVKARGGDRMEQVRVSKSGQSWCLDHGGRVLALTRSHDWLSAG
jgi:hypothetical protein